MEKMAAVQRYLANAIIILGDDADLQKRYNRVYNECLCQFTMDDLPHVLRKDYHELLTLTKKLHCIQEQLNMQLVDAKTDSPYEMTTMLPVAILLLYKHLTEWMAVEGYLYNQRHTYR